MASENEVQSKLDQIAKLPKGVRIGILAGIAVLMAASYYLFFYKGAQENLERLRAQELQLQRQLSEVRSVAANLEAFEEEIAGLQTKLGDALRQLPNEKQLEVLLTDMSNLGKTSGVEIKSFKRRAEVVHDFYAEVPIELELEGGYHDIARFFEKMAKLPRIVNMGSLEIKVEDENINETRLRIDGTATTFRFVGSRA